MRAEDPGPAPLRGHAMSRVPPLPRLGIGCGTVALGAAQDAFRELVEAAVAEAPCLLDTAPLYANGESEARLGEVLRGLPRTGYVLATKTGRYPAPAGSGRGVIASRFDYSRDGTLRSAETSLARLGTDRLDIVHIHDLDERQHGEDYAARRDEALDGAIPALRQLRDEGVIGAIGIASMEWRACLDLARAAEPDLVMLAGGATLLDRDSDPLFAFCAAQNLPVIVASPLNSGILATGATAHARYNYAPAPATVLTRVAAMQAACARHSVPLTAAALQYPAHRHAIASLLVGHAALAEYRANLALLDLPVPTALWDDLETL